MLKHNEIAMKKIYLLILITFSFSSYGQIAEGSSFIEGRFDFLNQKTTTSPSDTEIKTNGFGAIFGVGSFISDNSAIGGGVSYSRLEFDDFNSNQLGLNVFFQRFKSIRERFYFTPRINASYVFGKSEFDSGFGSNPETKISGIELSWIPGFQYAFDEKWVLGATIGAISYSNLTEKDSENSDNKVTESSFNVSMLANNFNLTVQYYFGKKD